MGNYDLETLRSDSETQRSGFGPYDSETKARDLGTMCRNHELETMNGKLLQVIRQP